MKDLTVADVKINTLWNSRNTLALAIPLALLIFPFTFLWLKSEGRPQSLRVASTTIQAALRYDPADMLYSYENLFLENVFSTLLEFDNSGAIVPALAESYSWRGDDLVLKIRKMKTENDGLITAADVEFSLKRLIILSGNKQGNFKNLVCRGNSLKSIESRCGGILVSGDEVILNAGAKKSFLLAMLTATEFSIVPRVAVDTHLKIRDMRQTTGPYFVERDEGNGRISLKLNRNHFHASDLIPQSVEFIPLDFKSNETPIQALMSGKVDHLMTVNGGKQNELLEFIRDHRGFESHITHKLSKHVLTFTDVGLARFTTQQRRWLSRQIKTAALAASANWLGASAATQFFLAAGDGGLLQNELIQISKLPEEPIRQVNFRLGFLQKRILESWRYTIQKQMPGASLIETKDIPGYQKPTEAKTQLDAFVINVDSGAMEDINLISNNLGSGHFGRTLRERSAWLSDYTATLDSRDRLSKLRKIHYDALASATVSPLVEFPFVAITTKPWKMDFSLLSASNPFWKIYAE